MQRKDLALRVLSTAAIMSIVTSIAAPAFADIYYIGNGSIDVVTKEDADGKKYVEVKQGDKTYTDKSNEIVIKDGTSEEDATLKEEKRAEGTQAKPAVAPAAGAATQELEAAGTAAAAGESTSDPDAAFNLSEEEEDSAQNQEGKDTTKKDEDTTEPPTDNPKKDVVYEYAPADPEPEKPTTKLAPTTSAAPTAKTKEATQDDAPTTTAPAEGSAGKPTKNVIRVFNDWVGEAAKELKIRLSNVNIKAENAGRKAAMDVSGGGKTKVELDGQNVLDSYSVLYQAGLRKQGEGTLTITDETNDTGKEITTPKSESDTSGSLTAKGAGGNGAAGIGGSVAEGTKNITIEGYATVHAAGGGSGAGIGGGGIYGDTQSGDAENIIIQGYATVDAKGSGSAAGIGGGGNGGNAENIIIRGHSKVTATTLGGAAIGGGYGSKSGGSAKGIVIRDHATVVAKSDGGFWLGDSCAAIGAAGNKDKDTEAEVTIGTPGATAATEDVNVTATGLYGSAIGSGTKDTKVTIQGNATIRMESRRNSTAIGSNYGDVEVNIKDNVAIDAKDEGTSIRYEGGGSSIGGGDIRGDSNRKVVVNIDGGTNGKVKIGDWIQIFGKYGAISGTEVNIGDNVLLKMKPWKSPDDKYINVKGAEAAVGTRNNPAAGGLVNTIGDNTELWYSAYGRLQKIVHGKNVCTKKEIGRKDATCTEDGWVKYGCTYESDRYATAPEHNYQWTETIPATGHRWGEWVEDTAAGTRTRECSVCHATETEPLPSDTNSALELRVVDAEGMDQPFTVSQNGTLRTYTGAYDTATLTGDLDTLRYLQDHGAQTIQFVTNGQTSSFDINDLLAQGSGSEVFYLTHRGAEEPTLLLVEADHSDLVKD